MAMTSLDRFRLGGGLLLWGLVLPGCFSFVTKEEGQKMQDQINQLQTKSEQRSQDLSDKLQKQSQELQKLLDEAKRLTSVLADSAQKTDKLQGDLLAVQGRAEDLQKSLDALQKSFTDYRAQSDTKIEQLVNASTTAKSPPLPDSPDALYAEAQKRVDGKQWNEARRMLEAFINRYPTDKRGAAAQFKIGEAYFSEGKYANAIGAFTKVIDNFPKAEEVESAMFKNGQAFYALKYCGDARIYFQELLKRYPRTQYKAEAQEQVRELTRQAKNKNVCQS